MLQASAKELLYQLKEIILSCREEDFSNPLPELSNSTFGQHVRHTLEFFLCLFDAKNEGIINYDTRKHDKFIETDPSLAMSVIDSIHEFLQNQKEDFPISFEANYTLEEGVVDKMPSSFYRELAYNIEHAIHHMALLKVAVNQSLNYIKLPENFGVATSTIRYQAGSNA
ncbi:MAG: DinB family protein [Cyclobacteriaceae bacterium]